MLSPSYFLLAHEEIQHLSSFIIFSLLSFFVSVFDINITGRSFGKFDSFRLRVTQIKSKGHCVSLLFIIICLVYIFVATVRHLNLNRLLCLSRLENNLFPLDCKEVFAFDSGCLTWDTVYIVFGINGTADRAIASIDTLKSDESYFVFSLNGYCCLFEAYAAGLVLIEDQNCAFSVIAINSLIGFFVY